MKNLGELYSVVLPMFIAIVASQQIPLHAALTEWKMRAQLREAETGSITAQRKILHVNQCRSQWKSTLALGEKYYKVTWASLVETMPSLLSNQMSGFLDWGI